MQDIAHRRIAIGSLRMGIDHCIGVQLLPEGMISTLLRKLPARKLYDGLRELRHILILPDASMWYEVLPAPHINKLRSVQFFSHVFATFFWPLIRSLGISSFNLQPPFREQAARCAGREEPSKPACMIGSNRNCTPKLAAKRFHLIQLVMVEDHDHCF